MKHLYSLIAIMFCMIGIASCSDDDYKYEPQPDVISIIESKVLFTAEASVGTVRFDAPAAVTVSVDKEWCHATVDGSTINVSVDENTNYEGRMATLTLQCGASKKDVYVQQNGIIVIFGFKDQAFDVPYTGETYVINGESTDAYTIECAADWIKAEQTETGIKVTVMPNKKREREAIVTVSSPAHENYATLTFKQEANAAQREPELPGSYLMTYHTTKAEDETDLVTVNVTLRQDAADKTKFYLDGLLAPEFNYAIPLRHDETNHQLVMDNCPVLGVNGEYWLVAVCLYTTATSTGTISYTQDETRAVYFDYVLDEENATYSISLHNSAKELINSANTSKGFSIYNFTSDTSFKSSTRKSGYATVRVPELKQIVED